MAFRRDERHDEDIVNYIHASMRQEAAFICTGSMYPMQPQSRVNFVAGTIFGDAERKLLHAERNLLHAERHLLLGFAVALVANFLRNTASP